MYISLIRRQIVLGVIAIVVALSLVTAIVLLLWNLLATVYFNDTINGTCPPSPCLSSTTTSASSEHSSTISSSSETPPITSTASTAKPTSEMKRTYRESCGRWVDCNGDSGLLCEFGWQQSRSCLCEGSHYWSKSQNKCLRKGDINDNCSIDYQCHREIGLVCDRLPGASANTCVCAARLYWAKDSNCGQINVRHIVDCTDESHASTCLVLDTADRYHMVTIRSMTQKELSFDWFLVDNPVLLAFPQLSCALNNETKYCFGLNAQDTQRTLNLVQFTRKGFHSVEDLAGVHKGTAVGVTNSKSVAVFARTVQNALYRRIIANDEILTAHDVALSVSGDPSCYIDEFSSNRRALCFVRGANKTLIEYAELSTDTWSATRLGNASDRLRDEAAPVCSYVGRLLRYCFAILENGLIYRIRSSSFAWGSWQPIDGDRSHQFLAQPLFVTSKPLNYSGADQFCYLLAIDQNNHLQLSTNPDCTQSANFSQWVSLPTNIKLKQLNHRFRLRDGTVGVFGVDVHNYTYYLTLDQATHRFTTPRLALTMKPTQFRP